MDFTQKKPQLRGFSLFELVIALAIVAIITLVAIPNYTSYLKKTRRTDATSALLDLATRMERYYAENNSSYLNANVTGNLGLSSTTTSQGYYTLSIPTLTATTYTLQATPVSGKSQADDNVCKNYTLTQSGQKGISGSGTVSDCWNS